MGVEMTSPTGQSPAGLLHQLLHQLLLGTAGLGAGWVPFVLLLATLCWLVGPWLRRYLAVRRMELAISGPPSLPLFGNALSVLGINADNVFQTIIIGLWGGRSTELSRVSIFHYIFVFVSDPDHIGKVNQEVGSCCKK